MQVRPIAAYLQLPSMVLQASAVSLNYHLWRSQVEARAADAGQEAAFAAQKARAPVIGSQHRQPSPQVATAYNAELRPTGQPPPPAGGAGGLQAGKNGSPAGGRVLGLVKPEHGQETAASSEIPPFGMHCI